MIQIAINKDELFESLEEASGEFLELISLTPEDSINLIPFEDSWTVAEVASHLTKSNKAIEQSLHMKGNTASRNLSQRVQELRDLFLDFSVKFKSPEFILPTKEKIGPATVMENYKDSIEQLRITGSTVDLFEMIDLPAFGEITKFELLYFVLFHTQRHTHQLKNILKRLEELQVLAGKK